MTDFLDPGNVHHRTENMTRAAPLPWRKFRATIRYRWAAPFATFDWLSQWAIYGLRRLSILELMETCSSFTLLIGLIFYFAEAPERTKTRHYQAWQVINTAQGKGGSGGRIDALRELNEDGVPLVGVDVSDAYLQEVRLERADLRRSNFHGTDLKGADLHGSNFEQSALIFANLRDTILNDVNLNDANLNDADLTDALLHNARIAEASFDRADLRGADFDGITDWKMKTSWRLANIHGLRNPPPGFVAWAQSNGAVDIVSDAEWSAAITRAQSTGTK